MVYHSPWHISEQKDLLFSHSALEVTKLCIFFILKAHYKTVSINCGKQCFTSVIWGEWYHLKFRRIN